MNTWKKEEEILEKEIAEIAKVSSDYIIAHKESEEGGLRSYRSFGHVTESGEIPIMYIDRNGKPRPYDDKSPISLRKEPSKLLYIFTKKEYRDKVSQVCRMVLG
jgi:hypothetical protein